MRNHKEIIINNKLDAVSSNARNTHFTVIGLAHPAHFYFMLNLKRNLDFQPLEGGNGATQQPAKQANELHLSAISDLLDRQSPQRLMESLHFMFVECSVKPDDELITPAKAITLAEDYMVLWNFLSTISNKGGNSHG